MRVRALSRAVVIVFFSYFGMDVTNYAIHDSLCQDGVGLTRSKAPAVNIHLMPFSTVDQLFQTSAFEAESWPPLVKGVSIAAQASWPHKAIATSVQPPVRERTKVAQDPAQAVLNAQQLALHQLALRQQGSHFLRVDRLEVHRP
ncbi:hypothetical protein ABIB81_008538 [Bradyrhizobium sp. I1.7.5]